MKALVTPLWLAILALSSPPALAQAPGSGGQPDSIEALLERARQRRNEVQARLLPQVKEIVDELELVSGRNASAEMRILREIGELGPEALPLFLPYLDPGLPKEKGPSYRAIVLAKALRRVPSDALTAGLIQLTTRATPEGQRLAVSVLAHQPADARIDAHLERRFQATEGFVRLECIRSLALRGGHGELLTQALLDSDPEILAAVLEALATRQAAEAAGDVFGLLERPRIASEVLDELTGYYASCPQVVDEQTFAKLLTLVLKQDIDAAARIKLLNTLPSFAKSLTTKQKRLLEPIVDSHNSELSEAGLVCMALMGHRPSRNELIKSYTKQIEEYGGFPKAYEDRADMHLRLGEFSPAVKDYKRSLAELGERAFLVTYRQVWFKLAKAYVGSNKLRQAMDALKDFGLGPQMRRLVLADPAFEPLIESRHGRELR